VSVAEETLVDILGPVLRVAGEVWEDVSASCGEDDGTALPSGAGGIRCGVFRLPSRVCGCGDVGDACVVHERGVAVAFDLLASCVPDLSRVDVVEAQHGVGGVDAVVAKLVG